MNAIDLENDEAIRSTEQLLHNVLGALEGLDPPKNEAQWENAAELLRSVKGLQKEAESVRKQITQPMLDEKRRIDNFFTTRFTAPLTEAENSLKSGMLAYQREQERKAREAQAAEEERARKERQRLAERAAKAEQKGQLEKADDLRDRAAGVVAPVVTPSVPKAKGISTREVWDFEITDEKAVPREYLAVDLSKIRKVVAAMKGDTNIPGVKVVRKETLAAAS